MAHVFVFALRGDFDHLGHVIAVVAVFDVVILIANTLWLAGLVHGLWSGEGAVHVKLVVGDDVEMVPELVNVVVRLFHLGVHLGHHLDDELGGFSAFLPILDLHQVTDHLLHVAAVFRDDNLAAFGVV